VTVTIDGPPDFGPEEPPYQDLFAPPPAPEELDTWAPIDLTTLPDEPPVQPTLGKNGVGLLYPGKRHVFSGPPESAKTIAAYALSIQVIRDGGNVILIDFEMGGYDARRRLYDLGATTDELRQLHYIAPNDPATTDRIQRLIDLQPRLVTIDAAAGAYDLEGLDDNKRQDVEKLSRLYVTAFWKAGIATLFVDHVVKNSEQRGNYAIGSERKLGGADAHIGFETIQPISRGTKGLYKIIVRKDRGGYLKHGHYATLDLSSDPDTHAITWQFKPAENETADAGYFRPTHLMEKVSVWLELQTEPATRAEVVDGLGGRKAFILKAITALVQESYAVETDGPQRSKLISTLRPYREADDHNKTEKPANGLVVPVSSRKFPGTDARVVPVSSPPLQGEHPEPLTSTRGQSQLQVPAPNDPEGPDADIPF
jgi:hypothetical protein